MWTQIRAISKYTFTFTQTYLMLFLQQYSFPNNSVGHPLISAGVKDRLALYRMPYTGVPKVLYSKDTSEI